MLVAATGVAVKVAWARAAAAMVEREVAAIGVAMPVGAVRGRAA